MTVFYDLVLWACALEGCRIEARGDKRYALAGTRMFVKAVPAMRRFSLYKFVLA